MQRALFARLLLQDARVIVLDEPFNAVDAKTVSDLVCWCSAGMAKSAPSSPPCTTLTWSGRHFRTCCCGARAGAWGPAHDVLTAENLLRARRMCEAFDDSAMPAASTPRSLS